MSEPNQAIEVSAPTVDEAIKEALDQLGASEDDVVIQVLSTPRSGVLGLGARPARVRVERRAADEARSGVMSPPPAPPLAPRSSPSAGHAEPSEAPLERPLSAPPAASPGAVPAEKPDEPLPPAGQELAPADGRKAEPERESLALEEQGREATAVLKSVLELMGERAEIRTTEEDSEGIELAIKGDGSGLLIGRHGQTLDALEYLVNRILARRIKDAVPITLDTEAYRERRRRQLHRMALSMGEQAKREHNTVTLERMPPRDRRIVHLALKDDPLIATRSTGNGFLRAIEIVPVGERRESGGGNRRGAGSSGGGGGRGRQRHRERERPRDSEKPVGQQGGFTHGQKKMF